jgi:hypothetical protein
MNTTIANGTYWSNFVPAIHSYIEGIDPGVTLYNSSLLTNSPTAWNFIYQQLASGSDLEILIQKTATNSGANHYLTVYGLSWDDTTANGTLSYMDPWTGAVGSASLFYDSPDNRLDLAYGGMSWVYGGASEGPISIPSSVPEPCTLLLFGSGLVGLVAYRLRSKKA